LKIKIDENLPIDVEFLSDTTEGIIVLRIKEQGKSAVIKAVRNLLAKLSGNFIPGQLWIVEENRIRVREKE
jgi:hypothetical protein